MSAAKRTDTSSHDNDNMVNVVHSIHTSQGYYIEHNFFLAVV